MFNFKDIFFCKSSSRQKIYINNFFSRTAEQWRFRLASSCPSGAVLILKFPTRKLNIPFSPACENASLKIIEKRTVLYDNVCGSDTGKVETLRLLENGGNAKIVWKVAFGVADAGFVASVCAKGCSSDD